MPRRQAGQDRSNYPVKKRDYLERVVRHPSTKNWDVLRAKIVLLWADGLPPGEVAKRADVSRQSVYNWVRRFRESRLAGLSDLPRSGRPRTISDDDVAKVVELTLESAPRGATHWSTRGLAKKTGMSKSTVGRIWQAFRLQPHRSESFELSNDPLFVDKVRDVVGLYLNPPARAVVFSVDEKTHIQALEAATSRDPSSVRVHQGPEASNAAQAVSARAFTVGHDIVFGANEYSAGCVSTPRARPGSWACSEAGRDGWACCPWRASSMPTVRSPRCTARDGPSSTNPPIVHPAMPADPDAVAGWAVVRGRSRRGLSGSWATRMRPQPVDGRAFAGVTVQDPRRFGGTAYCSNAATSIIGSGWLPPWPE